ncbi:type I-E CRISPR-associated protein Cse1/CasA [Thiorhodococcus mannitoliphagus]|uniref:Type I-E CRISPR-associated protein Cse1/CasA n=1 Tax=Thiorhodococcus mannitoliphagus TaxID=329406 RepID=A0A6P1E1C4_9GAMM|nr:type I-E CRISPR-associated protein Cse1/CasA [Thiorhodococcus mannitoliphagus]NEX23033.1 type I-E CRISPR-associated protein Cse1/CasA [Thiorhodococcus mannitoliphagus]
MNQTTAPAFNLLDEPWIPLRMLDGTARDVSLRTALLEATKITALLEASPTSLIALHRLLLAMLHRALTTHQQTWKDSDRARWYREGLPETAIRDYLAQWRDRFWLFHPKHPFMQVAELSDWGETSSAVFPVSSVAINLLYGTAMFEHGVYDRSSYEAGYAMRLLLGYLQFTPGGFFPGKKLKSSERAGPLANTAAVLPVGETLAETLLIGLHPPTPRHIQDLPAWEQEPPTNEVLRGSARLATGPNDRYTRQTRAALLVADTASADRRIRQVFIAAGISLDEDAQAPDPMTSYRMSKEGKALRLSFQDGRALWRELPALVPDATGTFNQPAAILSGATNLYARMGRLDAPIPVLVAGLTSDQAKLLRWRTDRVDLPLALLTDPDAAAELRAQISVAERLYFRLRAICAEAIAAAMPDPSHKDTRARARSLLDAGPTAPLFFSAAERALPNLMNRIAIGDVDAAHLQWQASMKLAVQRAWSATCRMLGESPPALRAIARAESSIARLLHALDEPDTAESPKEATP